MGFTVTAGDRQLHAIRLGGDDTLDSAFLQSVVGMSAPQYERRGLLRMAVEQGRAAPSMADSPAEVVGALRDDTVRGLPLGRSGGRAQRSAHREVVVARLTDTLGGRVLVGVLAVHFLLLPPLFLGLLRIVEDGEARVHQ
jgi:hypothetical protein